MSSPWRQLFAAGPYWAAAMDGGAGVSAAASASCRASMA